MNALRHIRLAIVQVTRRVRLLPQSVANAFLYWRRQAAWNEREAERLDRIRNPSKYRGK